MKNPGRLFILIFVMDTVVGLWLPHLITEHSEHVLLSISEHTSSFRRRRSTDAMPFGIDVTLKVQGRPVTLPLQRIVNAGVTLPVHIFRNGSIMNFPMDTEEVLSQHTGFYEDSTRDALILLQRHEYKGYTLFGTFLSGSDRYIIQQSNNDSDQASFHAVTRVDKDQLPKYSNDFIVPESLIYKKSQSGQLRRSKRQTTQYYIELYMVTDYSIYTFWKNRATGTDVQKDLEAKRNIREFYSYVLYGIDQRYRDITDQTYTVRVISPGLLILDNAADSHMIENNKVVSFPRDTIGSSKALGAFNIWENGQTTLPQRDHTMLFTHYDLLSGTGGDSAGIAYVKGLCGTQAQSVIEDEFNPFTMTTAAHELGHSLGAKHDGDGNICSGRSNYIMAPVNSVATDPERIRNMWIFSSCSVTDFTSFISELNRNGDNCMTETSPSSAFASIDRPMAEAYSPDDICSFTEGEGSYVCRTVQDYASLCAVMYCNAPGTSQCYTVLPPEGTSCGSGKICQKGRCVSSANAPLVSDDCPLGDRPDFIQEYSATCSDYISVDPGRCYTSTTRETCCESCAAEYTGVSGCEYGDQADFCKTLTRQQCYWNANTCCGFCNRPDIKDISRPGCEYGDRFSNCRASSCPFYPVSSLEGCCGTCGVIPGTTTTTTKVTTTTPSTTTKTTTATTKTTTTRPSTTPVVKTSTTSTTPSAGTATVSKATTRTTAVPTEKESSDSVIIGVGAGIGVVVVIVVVVIIIFIFLKRRGKPGRKHSAISSKSSDNAYDSIGIVSPSAKANMPHHPPPRRDNSVSSPVRAPQIPGPANREIMRPPKLNLNSFGNQSSAGSHEVEGYMTPKDASVSTVSNGVHYTAPNKPKFNFNLPNGERKSTRNDATDSSNDSPSGQRRPIHYRRSGALSDSNGSERDSKETNPKNMFQEALSKLNSVQNIGTRNDKVATEKPVLNDKKLVVNKPDNDAYNEISEVSERPNERKASSDQTVENDIKSNHKNRPVPNLPPKPKPRPAANKQNQDANAASSSRPKVPTKPALKNKDCNTIQNNSPSSEGKIGGMPVLPMIEIKEQIESQQQKTESRPVPRPPLKPPTKPVPRRQKKEDTVGQDNLAFEEDNVVTI